MDTQIVQEAEKIANDKTPEQNTWAKLSKPIIYGKKTIMFEMTPADLQHFARLHREDKNGYMQQYSLKKMTEEEAVKFCAVMFATGQLKCWSVYLKQTSLKDLQNERRAGFIYLHCFTDFSCAYSGIMDTAVMKGLLKHIRHGDTTFAEDAVRTILKHCFDCGLSRIETTVLENNRRALALDKKCGLIEEGRFRKAFHMDNIFIDVIQLAILREDLQNV